MGAVHTKFAGHDLPRASFESIRAAIPHLSPRELESLTEDLIDRLDELTSDADLEEEPDLEDSADAENFEDDEPD